MCGLTSQLLAVDMIELLLLLVSELAGDEVYVDSESELVSSLVPYSIKKASMRFFYD